MEIQVLRNVFKRNDALAGQTREMLNRAGVTAFNMIGSAGAGKTSLLEFALPLLGRSSRIAVLEGDIATTRDAERIAKVGTPVIQLTTEGGCHLSAALVYEGMKRLALEGLDAVFVENVGNLVCPASFDIGEHVRIAVLSCAEGDDKPAKYPLIFKTANLVVLTKSDLAELCDFKPSQAERFIRTVNPDVPVMLVSVRTGQGMDEFIDWIGQRISGMQRGQL
jgi:hydrogenase nickel incorporation protein HypB